jgi:hypothetical protein
LPESLGEEEPQAVVDSFYDKDEILWAWALRVNVHIMDRNMKQIANGAAILPMLPADDKLSLK